jgi:prevent-host-death family protein
MTSISISEAKARLSALLGRVRAGEIVVITDRGIPVAQIVSAAAAADSGDDDGRLRRLEKAGVARRPRSALDVDALLALPLPKARESVLEALLEERRTSER